MRIQTQSVYVPQRSNPLLDQYLFAYFIAILNDGGLPATLLSRHWIIVDARGRVEEVKGLGVVGEQPRIVPGASFEYSSACPLATQSGIMRGFYHMIDDRGIEFSVPISPFKLAIHASLN
ncbi:MAG: Co2+/Mg2+ efflux protein ApaG [Candidatus Hydrogenedentes bacterium]|nr:Co2+/Mg2+ efflux protein ApaG [Candidatus Hydrogenedentota bacterium]MBI3119555.1 Co2+/Mg2+ efflux protein ApaG [Candidatus Hydrogenedentota bacterium]